MEANELRLGVYVNSLEHGDFKVVSMTVYEKAAIVFKSLKGDPIGCKIEDLNPIPLTEEWLLEFGLKERYVKGEWSWFDCKREGFWSSDTEIKNTKNSGATKGYIYNRDYPEILYVHQLQNLYFALTGQELTVKQ